MEQQRRAVAGARRRRARLRAEAAARVAAELKAVQVIRRRGWQANRPERMMAVMEPGKWYGARDIAELSGLEVKGARSTLVQRLLTTGLVERVQNPAWAPRGSPGGVGNPQQMMANPEVEPMWLYRLTELGEKRRGATGSADAPPSNL